MTTIEEDFAGKPRAVLHCQKCGDFTECCRLDGLWYCIFCYTEWLMGI